MYKVLGSCGWETFGNGRFVYPKSRQKIPNVGPIPAGEYSLPTKKTNDISVEGNLDLDDWNKKAEEYYNLSYLKQLINKRIDVRGEQSWGRRFVRLKVISGTETFGRSKFNIHGGWDKGSSGCIDIGNNDIDFFNVVRLLSNYAESVKVIVDYSGISSKKCKCKEVLKAQWKG